MIDLLQQGKYFEARDLRSQYADKLPLSDKTFDLVYKSHTALFFNKPDSISIYLEDLTTNHELLLGPVIGAYYGKLLQTYADTQQFEKGIKLVVVVIFLAGSLTIRFAGTHADYDKIKNCSII